MLGFLLTCAVLMTSYRWRYGAAPFNFQIPQEIPRDVWEAYEQLVAAGYTWNLIKDAPPSHPSSAAPLQADAECGPPAKKAKVAASATAEAAAAAAAATQPSSATADVGGGGGGTAAAVAVSGANDADAGPAAAAAAAAKQFVKLWESGACDDDARAALTALERGSGGFCGRVIHGSSTDAGARFDWLCTDHWKRLSWVFGPDAPALMLGLTPRQFCLKLGFGESWYGTENTSPPSPGQKTLLHRRHAHTHIHTHFRTHAPHTAHRTYERARGH